MAPSSSSSALFRRLICPKGIAGSCASWFHRRGVCTAARNHEDCSSPWLMLSPTMPTTSSYKFYSLADKKLVLTSSLSDDDDVISKLTCRGSSHGWLALLNLNNSNNDDAGVRLYNPITRRHINLPSILNLPAYPDNDINSSKRYIDKIILSSSPDEDDCVAVMVRDCGNQLAFCRKDDDSWTTMMTTTCDGHGKRRRCYDDCVYSATRKLFFGLTTNSLETWDLRDPSSPRLVKRLDFDTIGYHYRYYNFRPLARYAVDKVQHLVVAEQQDQDDDPDLLLFVVIQHTMYCVGPDGSCFADFDERKPDNCRYMTIGFDVYKYDGGGLEYVDRGSNSLGGLALFVGEHSHSVAIPATRFQLQPNSVYFTDPLGGDEEDEDLDELFLSRGHDIGVFDYEDKTVSSCYYPCDVRSLKTILPAPIWFFPSHTI